MAYGQVVVDTSIDLQRDALENLAREFECEPNPEEVLSKTFFWYYVPVREDLKERALMYARRAAEVYQKTGTLPDWFWRVYALRVDNEPVNAELSVGMPHGYQFSTQD